jgi:hypothetical protein
MTKIMYDISDLVPSSINYGDVKVSYGLIFNWHASGKAHQYMNCISTKGLMWSEHIHNIIRLFSHSTWISIIWYVIRDPT